MADFLTYDDIGDMVEDLMDDDDTDMRNIINREINNTYLEMLYPVTEDKPAWWLQKDTTVTTIAGQQGYNDTVDGGTDDLATDIRRILSISVAGDPIDLVTDIKELDLSSGKGYYDTSTRDKPIQAYLEKIYAGDGTETNNLKFYLTPDAIYLVHYWYEILVPRLSAAADVPRMPEFAHASIAYGTLLKLALFDISIKAGPWGQIYADVVAKLNKFRLNKHFQV